MSKERISDEERAEPMWTDWFQTLKLNDPKSLGIFFTILGDFVEENSHTASYLTIEDLHAILLDEI